MPSQTHILATCLHPLTQELSFLTKSISVPLALAPTSHRACSSLTLPRTSHRSCLPCPRHLPHHRLRLHWLLLHFLSSLSLSPFSSNARTLVWRRPPDTVDVINSLRSHVQMSVYEGINEQLSAIVSPWTRGPPLRGRRGRGCVQWSPASPIALAQE